MIESEEDLQRELIQELDYVLSSRFVNGRRREFVEAIRAMAVTDDGVLMKRFAEKLKLFSPRKDP